MAIITTPARLQLGSFLPRQAQFLNNASFNLTTANGGIAFPFIAERTMTVTDIGAPVSALVSTITAALTVGIQTDTAGLPSGTFLTTGSVTIPANTWATAAQFSASTGNPLIITTVAHTLQVGDSVLFANTTGGTATNTYYYVASVPNVNQFTVSTSSTLSPVFNFTASVSPGTNTFSSLTPSWTHSAGISAAITQGTRYWLCYQWSGTATGQLFFNVGDNGGASGQSVMYGLGYANRSAGTWSKVATTRGIPIMYSNGSQFYGTPQMASGRVTSSTLNNNDRFGFRFTVPAGHPDVLLDRITFAVHPTTGVTVASTWKAQLFADAGAGTPTLITDLSLIAGDSLGASSGAGNFASTIFQTNTTTWLTAGTSYLLICGFDVTPVTGAPSVNYFTGQVLTTTKRNNVVGAYGGDFIFNWQGANTWFTNNPEGYAPWSITTAAMRYNDSGGGAGGFANASCGFACLGGN